MKTKQFLAHLKTITTYFHVDIEKIPTLDIETRADMVRFLVRNRMPVIKELIPDDFDYSWLHAMGYLYETKGERYTFVHTSEQKIR